MRRLYFDDDGEPMPARTYRCGDRTCGAPDCRSCFPFSAQAFANAERDAALDEDCDEESAA